MQAFAERGFYDGGVRLTAQLLGCCQAAGFQDELALHLPRQLFHEERLLELGWGGRVFGSLCQKGSVSEMAHFNSIRVLMSYKEGDQMQTSSRLSTTSKCCKLEWTVIYTWDIRNKESFCSMKDPCACSTTGASAYCRWLCRIRVAVSQQMNGERRKKIFKESLEGLQTSVYELHS